MARQYSSAGMVGRTDVAKSGAGQFALTGGVDVVIPANAARAEFTITNNGAAACWVGLGANPAANRGVRLNAGGGSYTSSAFTGEVRVLGTAADVVSFVEV